MSGLAASVRDLAGHGPGFWVALGVVHVEPGESKHWRLTEEGQIAVSVRLDDHAAPTWALLAVVAGALQIPVPGTEVVVLHSHGQLEGVPVIVGSIPVVSQQVAEAAAEKALIVASKVWIYDGTGTPAALALKADAESVNQRISAIESGYNAHTHLGVTAGAGVSGVPATPSSTSATINGTTVAEAQ